MTQEPPLLKHFAEIDASEQSSDPRSVAIDPQTGLPIGVDGLTAMQSFITVMCGNRPILAID